MRTFVKIVLRKKWYMDSFAALQMLKELKIAWSVKLDTEVMSRSPSICCRLAREVITYHPTAQLKFIVIRA